MKTLFLIDSPIRILPCLLFLPPLFLLLLSLLPPFFLFTPLTAFFFLQPERRVYTFILNELLTFYRQTSPWHAWLLLGWRTSWFHFLNDTVVRAYQPRKNQFEIDPVQTSVISPCRSIVLRGFLSPVQTRLIQ